MTVKDVLDIYRLEDNYVQNSMLNQSYNDLGCTYKWFSRNTKSAFRRELFIATSTTEEDIEDRTILEYIEIQ